MCLIKLLMLVSAVFRSESPELLISFQDQHLAELTYCPNALWIRYFNLIRRGLICIQAHQYLCPGWRDMSFSEDSLWVEERSIFSVKQSFSVGRVHHKINSVMMVLRFAECSKWDKLDTNVKIWAHKCNTLTNLISQQSEHMGSRFILVSNLCVKL